MLIKKAFKVRLYPTQEQERIINQTIGNCRFWFNKCLESLINWRKKHTDYIGFKSPTPKQFKKQLGWLSEGSSRALQQAQRDLLSAFQNMKKMKSGFPKFKKKGLKDSYREPQSNNQIRVKGNVLKLLKVGFIKYSASDSYIESLQSAKIINATVSKNKAGQYFASILCDIQMETKEAIDMHIGLDLGIKEFFVSSHNEIVANPHFLINVEDKIKMCNRRLSRKVKGSKRYELQRIKLAKLYLKVANQRYHFLQTMSTRLINENQVICLEDLNVKGMIKNHTLAKAIHDVSWNKFVSMLIYKADWYKRDIVFIDRFYPSSKTCSKCGWIKEDLELSDRTFVCKSCNLEIDRDLNAANNILKQGMAELAKTETLVSTFVDKKINTKTYRLKPTVLANHLGETKTGIVDE